ncbi:MAG: glycosyltransferase [Candidatus Eisenbacteria sp.]|nr:glycosyltransferase [Candidatus Eisenbacteria bacterium]
MRKTDVATVHVVTSGMHVLGPMVACAARMCGKPLLVRTFGGGGFLPDAPARRVWILWTLRWVDLLLVETRELVRFFTEKGLRNTKWYANSRPMPALPEGHADDTRACRRFVFLSQLHRTKGVAELMDAAERFPEGVSVDVYGILGFDFPASAFEGRRNVTYRGPVEPADVMDVLSSYDALVLPTYYTREGYPGVILEAYAVGMPVVSTRHGGIPEVVDESTGILVEPRDVDALHAAMLSLVDDPGLFRRLRDGVLRRRSEFSDDVWQERFVEYCRELASARGGDGHLT